MKFFHRTYHAEAILAEGFRNGNKSFGNPPINGVWFSADAPLDANEGAAGDVVLAIEVPDHIASEWEVSEEGKPYREFIIPAEIVNQYGPPAVIDSDWAGITLTKLEATASWLERLGSDYAKKRAARVRELIPFLQRHNLLGTDDDQDAEAPATDP